MKNPVKSITNVVYRISIGGLLAICVVIPGYSWAQLNVTDVDSGAIVVEDIVNLLVDNDNPAVVSNIQVTGDNRCMGLFSGGSGLGAGALGFDSGIVISSGSVLDAVGPNSSDDTSGEFFTAGDAFLDSLVVGSDTFDACVIEFDFSCGAAEQISVEYVMASEEYNEFVSEGSNDVFAFALNGTNIATIPSSMGLPVSISNLNCGNPFNPAAPVSPNAPFCDLFINNDIQDGGGDINIEADGLTTVLTATGDLITGTNHMKLAVADVLDESFDTWVFLRSGSFQCVSDIPDPPDPIAIPDVKLITTRNKAFFGDEYFLDEDIVQIKLDGTRTRYFDGSDVGLADTALDAFFVSSNGDLFLSISQQLELPDIGLLKNEDIVRFRPSSLGINTLGTFSRFFTGADFGLLDGTHDMNIDALFIDEGRTTEPLNDDDNDGILNVGDSCPLDAQNDSDGNGICDNVIIYMSLTKELNIDGMTFADEDVFFYKDATASYGLLFDGSDVGLAGTDIDAFRLQEDGSLLLSLKDYITIPEIGVVADHDIVRFIPESLGGSTAGSFEIHVDGYATGIEEYYVEEDFDFNGVDLTFSPEPEPLLLYSLNNTAYNDSEYFYNEDIVKLRSDGSSTRLFDGSDVGLTHTGIDGFGLSTSYDLFLSVTNYVELNEFGLLKNEDIVRFKPDSLGAGTRGTYIPFFVGSQNGLIDTDVDINIDGFYVDEGEHSGAGGDDDNDGIVNELDTCPLDENNDVDGDGICGNVLVYLSLAASTTVQGIAVSDEDILVFSEANDSYAIYFDGSDVGLKNTDIDALRLMKDGRILLSFNSSVDLPGIGTVADYDVVRFTPRKLGQVTEGNYEKYAQGDQFGLVELVAEEDFDLGALGLYFN